MDRHPDSNGNRNGRGTRRQERPVRRIMVVEDDARMRDLLVKALAGDGYEVLEAVSGESAALVLESLSMGEPPTTTVDLVLSDVRMAEGDGLHLGRLIRDAGWPIPLIYLTAFPEADVTAEAARLDAQLLQKPCPLWLLRRVVLTTLARATA